MMALTLAGCALPLLASMKQREAEQRDAVLRGCDKDRAAAQCFEVGQMYENSKFGVEVDMPRARSYYTRACEMGHALACPYADRLERAQ